MTLMSLGKRSHLTDITLRGSDRGNNEKLPISLKTKYRRSRSRKKNENLLSSKSATLMIGETKLSIIQFQSIQIV